ncbi:hypothetical protein CRG98_003817 [Punica granatum]|uniref:Reverse transcriptase Ty1/copia-type domain-containing protein n=1 Tax=Punica granatum TaxID=22663 RepID=A0A2I0L519_PUNGR|nr:hypothetical protein CRG98_003817 [Punica granatum]
MSPLPFSWPQNLHAKVTTAPFLLSIQFFNSRNKCGGDRLPSYLKAKRRRSLAGPRLPVPYTTNLQNHPNAKIQPPSKYRNSRNKFVNASLSVVPMGRKWAHETLRHFLITGPNLSPDCGPANNKLTTHTEGLSSDRSSSGSPPRSTRPAVSFISGSATDRALHWCAAVAEEILALELNGYLDTHSATSRQETHCLQMGLPVSSAELMGLYVIVIRRDLLPRDFRRCRFSLDFCTHSQTNHSSMFSLDVAIANHLELHRIYVHMAFLQGDFDEEVYMFLLPDFSPTQPSQVCCLRKSLYGLRQASQNWFAKIAAALRRYGFPTVYN